MTAPQWTTVPAAGGDLRAFTVAPDLPPPWPALIVIHPVMGLTDYVQGVSTEFAAEGYYVVAPDLYTHDSGYQTHQADDIEAAAHMGNDPTTWEPYLAHLPERRRAAIVRARTWIANRPQSTYIAGVRACHSELAARRDVAAIGCIGFCMGGRLTGELAAGGADLAAGVIYYGSPPDAALIPQIRCPLEGHYGASDTRITEKIPDFAAAMQQAGKAFTPYVYDAGHGFDGPPHMPEYNAEASRLARQRAKAFLARHLLAAVPAAK
jgi:carboxymethylenebutenolidase